MRSASRPCSSVPDIADICVQLHPEKLLLLPITHRWTRAEGRGSLCCTCCFSWNAVRTLLPSVYCYTLT